jgi:predicted O-linked N-acetylglucosamine transferase (SPINDLY family)
LLFKSSGLDEADGRTRMQARLAAAGVEVGRVELIGRTADTRSHLALYGRVDIALDTTPYHGTTTTCEALWMGVPVVSRRGDRHASRVGASLLRAIGHPEWSAETDDAYVRTAVALAADRAGLSALRAGLRAQVAASPLCDHAGQGRRFGAALRETWVRWCARRAAKAA